MVVWKRFRPRMKKSLQRLLRDQWAAQPRSIRRWTAMKIANEKEKAKSNPPPGYPFNWTGSELSPNSWRISSQAAESAGIKKSHMPQVFEENLAFCVQDAGWILCENRNFNKSPNVREGARICQSPDTGPPMRSQGFQSRGMHFPMYLSADKIYQE